MTERQQVMQDLLARSHRLGADRAVTNFGGGNTSAKAVESDPATGEMTPVLYVKGSGGDLATLTPDGLSVVDLHRLRSAAARYQPEGSDGEDQFSDLVGMCCFGGPSAAPSIDTAMHGLIDLQHVDHLHPDSVIALAAAADGEALVKECFGGEVAWVPWRRPGIDLALEVAELRNNDPSLLGVVLGGHGLTTWGTTSDECEANSFAIIRRAQEFIAQTGKVDPFGPIVATRQALPLEERLRVAALLAPVVRSICSQDAHRILIFSDSEQVLDFMAHASMERLAALGTSCPDHFLRTKIRPLVLDLPAGAPIADVTDRLKALHADYRNDYAAYYRDTPMHRPQPCGVPIRPLS